MPRLPEEHIEIFESRCRKMQKVSRMIAKAARTEMAILITGEKGVGKSTLAEIIHCSSLRAAMPYIKFSARDCGNTKGKALQNEIATYIEKAQDGTFFIDHLHELNVTQQADLSTVLDRGGFRLIAATTSPLETLVKEGQFIEELYHKVCVSCIKLPPLRERKEDIPHIISGLLKELAQKSGLEKKFDNEAFDKLTKRSWQGNIRELSEAVRYAFHQAAGDYITADDLPKWSRDQYSSCTGESLNNELMRIASELMQVAPDGCMQEYLQLVQPPLLKAALEFTVGNKSQAAQVLGINRNTLKKMLREYNIEN